MSHFSESLELLIQDIRGHVDLPEQGFIDYSVKRLEEIDFGKTDEDDVCLFALLNNLPRQYYSETQFGKYNLTVFSHKDVTIQVYVMDEIGTEIHSHPFVGAFKVLEGASFHMTYIFKDGEEVAPYVFLGELKPCEVKHLTTGSVVQLDNHTIHEIYRLNKKNISLIITKRLIEPNSFYLLPNIRVSKVPYSDQFRRKTFTIDLLVREQRLLNNEAIQYYFDHLTAHELMWLIQTKLLFHIEGLSTFEIDFYRQHCDQAIQRLRLPISLLELENVHNTHVTKLATMKKSSAPITK